MLIQGSKIIKAGRPTRLEGGVQRVIHVVAKALKESLDGHPEMRVIGIREESDLTKVIMAKHVEILGNVSLIHTPDDPIPGTDGRGVCVLRTNAPILVYGMSKG